MAASQRPEGPVSFSTLSSTARIINISPAWPSVAQALTYLRGTPPPLPGPEYDVAVQTVREFAELLRRNADTIANALICGKMLGDLRPARTTASTLRSGLMIISEAYRFSLRTEEEIREILRMLAAELPRYLDLRPAPIDGIAIGDSADGWVKALDSTLDAIAAEGFVRLTHLPSLVEPHLVSRVESFLTGKPPEDPRPVELVAHASGDVNSEFLRWDLGRMTALQWSRIITAWLQHEKPEHRPATWLTAAALAALGFVTDDPAGLAAWLDREVPEVVAATGIPPFRRAGAAASRAVLLVRDTKRTIAERWLPTPEVAALVLPPEPAARLMDRLASAQPPIGPELRLVAIEGVEGAGRLAGFLSTARRKDPFGPLRERFQFAHVLPSEVEADPFGLPGPVIVRPRGFQDLVERMEARVSHSVAQASKM
jgi:hypothetical protein